MGEPWFGQKAYGFGLSPRSWAGWWALIIFVMVITAVPLIALRLGTPRWIALAIIGGLSVAFLVLVWLKSDRQPWRWRWGGR